MSEINAKIKELRKRILLCDWTPDAMYTRPGPRGMPTEIHYVTASKIKRNTAPLYAELGLDFKINMLSITDTEKGVRCESEVILMDYDSGETDVTRIISSSPTADKGEGIALTNVLREFYSSRFEIVDGLNFDEEHDDDAELRQTLRSNAIQPSAVQTEESESAKTTEVVSENKAETVKKTTPTFLDIPVKPKKASKLSAMEKKAMTNVMAYIESNKDISPDLYKKAKEIYENCTDSTQVCDLMAIKHEIESAKGPSAGGM